jgi:predicted amidohydrolase
MKIALIQLDANDKLWSAKYIPELLIASTGADLVVFPELMPFDKAGRQAMPIDQAHEVLSLCASSSEVAFIAGGYVRQDKTLRNAAFLAYGSAIHGTYFKRIRWQAEPINVGQAGVCFTWKPGLACIPLICADAADNPSPLGTQMMAEAIQLGANADTPIVVPSYGASLATPEWREPLQLWAIGCGAPVAICGISGKSRSTYLEDGIKKYYGGGGSAVFWPNGSRTRQSSKRGIYIVDTTAGLCEYRRIP